MVQVGKSDPTYTHYLKCNSDCRSITERLQGAALRSATLQGSTIFYVKPTGKDKSSQRVGPCSVVISDVGSSDTWYDILQASG